MLTLQFPPGLSDYALRVYTQHPLQKYTGSAPVFTKVFQDTIDLLVKGTAHTRMKVIGGKTTAKTSATSDVGRLVITRR